MKKEFYAELSQLLFKRLTALVYDYDVTEDVMTLTDADGQIRSIQSYRQKLYKARRMIVHPDFLDILSAIYAGHTVESTPILLDLSYKPSGKFSWHEILSKPIFDEEGHIVRTIGVIWKTDAPRESEADKSGGYFRSDKDPVTGLLNASCMQKLINGYLNKEGRELVHAVIEIKLKVARPVGSSYDKKHRLSEYALNILGSQLKNIFKDRDLLGYIYEGNFLIFMKDIRDTAYIQEKRERIIQLLEEKYADLCIPRMDYHIGKAVYPVDGRSYKRLRQAAGGQLNGRTDL